MFRNKSVVLIALAVSLAACGGGDSEVVAVGSTAVPTTAAPASTTTMAPATTIPTGASPELRVLQTAFASGAESFSGRFEGSIEVVAGETDAGPVDVSMPFGGSFDAAGESSSFYLDLSGMMAAAGSKPMPPGFEGMFGRMEIRQIGEIVYIQWPFVATFLGATTPWISMAADEGLATVEQFSTMSPISPEDLFAAYEDLDVEVVDLGSASVNGVEATHYRIEIDLEQAFGQLSGADGAFAGDDPLPQGTVPVEVWISEEGQVVRMVMEILGSSLGEDEDFESMSMRYDFFYGEDIVIEAPPASEVTEAAQLQGFGFGTTSTTLNG